MTGLLYGKGKSLDKTSEIGYREQGAGAGRADSERFSAARRA
jgi:hypothetical protein